MRVRSADVGIFVFAGKACHSTKIKGKNFESQKFLPTNLRQP